MDPALVSLAAAAGTALVQAMTRDGWEAAKARFASIFSRHGEVDEADLERELGATEQRLRSPAGSLEPAADEERQRWAAFLAAFLAQHGEAAPELRGFVHDLRQPAPQDTTTVVQQITAGRDAYTAGRDQCVLRTLRDNGPSRVDDEECLRRLDDDDL
ncbi:hypothetical protein [Sphaerisporangium corydalis]|uniref:Secreted protein n=1 Tax=Sphaerisporangium corydalis TaxID=1441875 RepID=A0ABV9E9U8_9ACTN|nr:hypothetical protein [Sphaerisporangium corydalis]